MKWKYKDIWFVLGSLLTIILTQILAPNTGLITNLPSNRTQNSPQTSGGVLQYWNRTIPTDLTSLLPFPGHFDGITLDSNGDVIIAGTYNPPGADPGDLFLAKYTPAGNLLFNTTYGSNVQDFGRGVAVDTANNIYLAGYSWNGTKDIVIVKYDQNGNQQWNRTWGWAGGNETVENIVVNGSDSLYIVGGNESLAWNLMLVKFDLDGNHLWNTTWGNTSSFEYGHDAAISQDGFLYATGYSNFGGGQAILVKYSSEGVYNWNRSWNRVSSYDKAFGVDIGPDDNVTIAGNTQLGTDAQWFAAQFSPAGDQLWNFSWGTPQADYLQDISYDTLGNFYLTGGTYGFGAGGNPNFWLAKFNSLQIEEFNYTCGNPSGYDSGFRLAIGGFQDIYIIGETFAGNFDMMLMKFNWDFMPTMTSHPDVFTDGAPGANISWIISDQSVLNPQYRILSNGTPGQWISWTPDQPVVHNLTALDVGELNVTIEAGDGLGNNGSDEVWVTVINLAPSSTQPSDITFLYGTLGHQAIWLPSDYTVNASGNIYSITVNGTKKIEANWTSGTMISFNMDFLLPGIFNITITLEDGYGGVGSDTLISIVSNTPPTLTHPDDVSYVIGTKSHILSWTPVDDSMGNTTFQIFRNGNLVADGLWTTANTIAISIDDLAAGTWVYIIVVDDGVGMQVLDEVRVIVNPEEIDWGRQIFYWVLGGVISAIAGLLVNKLAKTMKKRSLNRADIANFQPPK